MTIHEFPRPVPRPTANRPARSGEPWTDDDYTTLLRMAREGASESEVCEALERSVSAVQLRAKKLLPLDQRGVPGERVLKYLGELVRADEDYPWASHLAATPEPRPIVQHVLPTPRYAGVKGLEDAQLVVVAANLALTSTSTLSEDLADEVAREVVDRRFEHRLRQVFEEQTRGVLGHFLGRANPWAWSGSRGGGWAGSSSHGAFEEEVDWEMLSCDEPPEEGWPEEEPVWEEPPPPNDEPDQHPWA